MRLRNFFAKFLFKLFRYFDKSLEVLKKGKYIPLAILRYSKSITADLGLNFKQDILGFIFQQSLGSLSVFKINEL